VWKSNKRLLAFRQRVLSFEPARANSGWLDVLVAQGAARCGVNLEDEALLCWAKAWADHHTAVPIGQKRDSYSGLLDLGKPSRGIYLNSYCGDWGAPLALTPLHRQHPNPAYLDAITRTADHIMDKAVRAPDGTICHAAGLGIWVDTLYYTASVLAHAHAVTGTKRYAEEAVRQCLLHAKHLRDERTGLFYHDLDLKTGARTRNFWARGNGWIIMSLVDTLALVPQETEGREQVLATYRSQVEGLLKLQHASGLWRIVPEEPNAHLETSGTTMALCGLAAGLTAGWLPKTRTEPLRRGFAELLTWITGKGQLMGSQHPAGGGGWEAHKLSGIGEDSYTMGAFLRLVADLGKTNLIP
jgi:unsaturated rhamnogalacturonyl hydrolase